MLFKGRKIKTFAISYFRDLHIANKLIKLLH